MRNILRWRPEVGAPVFAALLLGIPFVFVACGGGDAATHGSIGTRLAAAKSACGGLDDPCCAGGTCSGSQLVCSGASEGGSGVCVRCGGTPHSHDAELCCADGTCNPGFDCLEGVCSGGCGQLDETCCGSSDQRSCSTSNLACDLEGFCAVCGVSGGPCCTDGSCHPGLTCYGAIRAGNDTCQCGGPDTTCCPGTGCVSGTTCESGTCRSMSCGGLDQPCCGGIVQCGADLFCSADVCTIPLG